MNSDRQREIARKGGRAAHEKGKAHEFTPDEARAAGRKGGEKVSVNRRHMAEIGRRGGRSSAQRRRPGSGGQQPGGNAGADMHRVEGRMAGSPQMEQGDGNGRAEEQTAAAGQEMAGGGAGALTGGLIGALVGHGIPEEHAKHYEQGLKEGGIVMGVNPRTTEDADYFEHEWRNNRAESLYR